MIQQMLAIWSLVPLPFLNPAWASFTVHILLKPRLENFEHYLHVRWVQLCQWKLTFSSPVATAEFSKFPGEYSTFTALLFRIWNSSTGIPSLPLALFVMMLPKAHLTFHSRISGYMWVLTPSWLSGSWRSFSCNASVYSCHLLVSFASVRSTPFLSFIVPIFAWNVPLVSLIFLKRSQEIYYFLLFLCSVH